MHARRGHCLCGQTRYSFDPNGLGAATLCHCESCRRATSSPVTAYLTIRNSAWRWVGAKPKSFASSAGVTRYFCGTCGAPIAYAEADRPDETDFHALTLIDPENFEPASHIFWKERLKWLKLDDGLPRHAGDSSTSKVSKKKKK